MSEVHRNPLYSQGLWMQGQTQMELAFCLNCILYVSDICQDLVCQKLYTCGKKMFFYILLSQGLPNCFNPILINLDFPLGVGT